jgi:hypothetical protein
VLSSAGIERGKATTNMRGRVRRVLRENDGNVEVYLLQLLIDSGYALCKDYLGEKLICGRETKSIIQKSSIIG